MPEFIPGKELSRRFYHEAVKPVIENLMPGLVYSAGLIDYGSDVLGYDDEVSRDHQWGPRLSIFLSPDDMTACSERIDVELSEKLPRQFCGYSVNFSGTRADYIRRMEFSEEGKVSHIIRIHSPEQFFKEHLGWDIPSSIGTQDWLAFPQQKLLTVRKGELFHDGLEMEILRKKLQYYPDDVWLYLMACEWKMIGNEEAFVGRCGDIGDENGSRIIASRILSRIMNLCFFHERTYIPYSKWFGTAFSELKSAEKLGGIIDSVLSAAQWKEREEHMSQAYLYSAGKHNSMNITKAVPAEIKPYYGRNYMVIFAGNFADALLECVKDPLLKDSGAFGNIEQITGVLDLHENADLRKRIIGNIYS